MDVFGTSIEWPALVTLIAAVGGFGILVGRALADLYRSRMRLVVDWEAVPPKLLQSIPALIAVRAVNTRRVPVPMTASGVKFKVGRTEHLVMGENLTQPDKPGSLAEGQHYTFSLSMDSVLRVVRSSAPGNVKLAGVVYDALGREHASKWKEFNPAEWTNTAGSVS
jgi:hypothetical protein